MLLGSPGWGSRVCSSHPSQEGGGSPQFTLPSTRGPLSLQAVFPIIKAASLAKKSLGGGDIALDPGLWVLFLAS